MSHVAFFPGSISRTGGFTPEGRRFYDLVAQRERMARSAPFTAPYSAIDLRASTAALLRETSLLQKAAQTRRAEIDALREAAASILQKQEINPGEVKKLEDIRQNVYAIAGTSPPPVVESGSESPPPSSNGGDAGGKIAGSAGIIILALAAAALLGRRK